MIHLLNLVRNMSRSGRVNILEGRVAVIGNFSLIGAISNLAGVYRATKIVFASRVDRAMRYNTCNKALSHEN